MLDHTNGADWRTNHAGIKIMIEYDVLDWPKGNEDVKTYYVHYVEGLEATAARRKELLMKARATLEILQDHHCAGIHEDHMEVMDMVNKLDRELAEELADDDD